LAGATLGFLSRLWARPSGPEAPRGTPTVEAVGQALALTESLACGGTVHRPAAPTGAALASGMRVAHGPALNAFDAPILEHAAAGARGGLAAAMGMTLAGVRTAAFLDGAELPGAYGVLRDAAARLVPLVVHASDVGADGTGHSAWHAAAETGAVL